jgi:branched-chain amino acid transport system ATP-binding protein
MAPPKALGREALLDVVVVQAGYGAVPVLRGVTLKVGVGEIVALLGPNGAGKTTLNRVLSGLVRPSGGRVLFAGDDITRADPAEIVAAGLAHVPEGRHVFPNLTVRENLELGSYRRRRDRRAANLEQVTAIFPRLAERMGQSAGTLSGGEQQMLAIGRGLMSQPILLVLDEPSLGLSPLLVEEMFELIQRIRDAGVAVLLVEQNVVRSLSIADRGYVLEGGLIALEGPAGTLVGDPKLKKSYLGM